MSPAPERRYSPFDRWLETATRFGRRVRRRPRVAFVLSGGGNLGAIQVGMLRALADAGVEPDLIVGCSVGSINGAAFAADPNSVGVARLERFWRRLAEGDPDLMPAPRLIPLVAQMARKGEALHDPERLSEVLDEELPVKTFERLRVSFSCVATDLETATEAWFDQGPLLPALMASAALPAVYPAYQHQGRTFIDGGVLREIHLHRAITLGATEIYALHVGHTEGRSLEVQRPFDAALRAYWTARRFRVEDDFAAVPAGVKVHRLPAGSKPHLRFDDFSQGAELIDLANTATAHYLRTGSIPPVVSGPDSAVDPDSDPEYEPAIDEPSADQPKVEQDVLDGGNSSAYPDLRTGSDGTDVGDGDNGTEGAEKLEVDRVEADD